MNRSVWLWICAIAAGLGMYAMGLGVAEAIIIRDDVPDEAYVVEDEDYPAVVDLISRGDCVGTLIHESWLLTVAHCAVDLNVGATLQVGGGAHEVAEVVIHPQWRDEDAFDIALVRFSEPVAGVVPYLVYRGSDEMGKTITLVGRGITGTGLQGEDGGSDDGKLRAATNVVTGAGDHFIEVRFERGGEPGVTELEGVGAAGDSGGPAFLDIDGVRYVAGLNSWGDGAGEIGVGEYGSRDYQTRVSRYVAWMEEHIPLPSGQPPDDGPGDGSDGSDDTDGGADSDGVTSSGCSAGGGGSYGGLALLLLLLAPRLRSPTPRS